MPPITLRTAPADTTFSSAAAARADGNAAQKRNSERREMDLRIDIFIGVPLEIVSCFNERKSAPSRPGLASRPHPDCDCLAGAFVTSAQNFIFHFTGAQNG